jgi:hypothetical protein
MRCVRGYTARDVIAVIDETVNGSRADDDGRMRRRESSGA